MVTARYMILRLLVVLHDRIHKRERRCAPFDGAHRGLQLLSAL